VDIRAEVGLLSRNVVVQGDAESYKCTPISTTKAAKEICTQFGGHIFLHSPGSESLKARIEHVELRNVGQVCPYSPYPPVCAICDALVSCFCFTIPPMCRRSIWAVIPSTST
jgi:hypothetical protein